MQCYNIITVKENNRKEKNMRPLTHSELEVLKEAEDILFSHCEPDIEGVFDDAFIALFHALRRYSKLEKRDDTCQNG